MQKYTEKLSLNIMLLLQITRSLQQTRILPPKYTTNERNRNIVIDKYNQTILFTDL